LNRLRIVNVVFLGAMIAGAIVTYSMKYQAERAAENVARLKTDIATQKDRIRTLTAEWAFLTQPSRLQAAIEEHSDYFALKPFSPDQLAAVQDIPFRKPAGAASSATPAMTNQDLARAALARLAAGGTLTGR
jgi:hypothetical protein